LSLSDFFIRQIILIKRRMQIAPSRFNDEHQLKLNLSDGMVRKSNTFLGQFMKFGRDLLVPDPAVKRIRKVRICNNL
jgi:hypothetical protein